MTHPPLDIEAIRRELLARRQALSERERRAETDAQHRLDPLPADSGERALQVENDETLAGIAAAAHGDITAIDSALARLALGTYGVCARCGKHIATARLKAIPHAVTCPECAAS